jgi:formamidopyrimidine-DNA glycosylase
MDLIPTDRVDHHPWFATMGPEPLGDGFDAKTLVKAFAGRKQGPKTLLLDQKTVAGLGNIYVCEALHRAHISPFKPSGLIAGKRLGPLTTAIKDVLTEAVEAGGSSLKDFAATDGALGYFQHRFRVYDREGEPCPTQGCKGVIAREVQAGRSTFFCPVCQV